MITKMLFTGWLIISTHAVDKGQHNYLLQDKQNNVHISYSSDKPLPYPENSWVKLKIVVECQAEIEPPLAPGMLSVKQYYCHADRVEEMKCTSKNSIIIGGRVLC